MTTKARFFTALLTLVLALSLATSADARRWRWWQSYGGQDRSYGDRGDRSERAERGDDRYARRARAEPGDVSARGPRAGGPFGTVVARLISGCAQQGDQLARWPFEDITRIAAPDEAQRAALESLRANAAQAADRLAADCPQSVPAAPAVRLEAVEQAIDAATAAFTAVEPSLQQFYAALDDEQKARLLRDLTLASTPRASDRSAERSRDRSERRRDRYRAYAAASNRDYDSESVRTDGLGSNSAARSVSSPPHATRACPGCAYDDASRASPTCGGEGLGVGVSRSAQRRCLAAANSSTATTSSAATSSANRWAAVCEDLTTALRNWPVRDIERGVNLSEPQRVAFYELVTASLKAADTLGSACPAESALTPLGRMTALRARLAAVRTATTAIRPALTRFYEALDQEQKVRFAGMN
jgi:hypothetical protein